MERQIIIVTRDSHFRDALERICSGQGDRVETAKTIATALKIAAGMPVCVVVADVSIEAVGDGVRLAKVIHAQNRTAKCFLIIDDESADVSSSTDNLPWLSFVHKPIPMLKFATDVVDAIRNSRG